VNLIDREIVKKGLIMGDLPVLLGLVASDYRGRGSFLEGEMCSVHFRCFSMHCW